MQAIGSSPWCMYDRMYVCIRMCDRMQAVLRAMEREIVFSAGRPLSSQARERE